jgi:hypothetical protein
MEITGYYHRLRALGHMGPWYLAWFGVYGVIQELGRRVSERKGRYHLIFGGEQGIAFA